MQAHRERWNCSSQKGTYGEFAADFDVALLGLGGPKAGVRLKTHLRTCMHSLNHRRSKSCTTLIYDARGDFHCVLCMSALGSSVCAPSEAGMRFANALSHPPGYLELL